MYTIIRADWEQAKQFEGFFRPDLFSDPDIKECIFFIGLDRDTLEVVAAAAVLPRINGAELRSISVAEEKQRQGFGWYLANYILKDLGPVYSEMSDAIPRLTVAEILTEQAWEKLSAFLEKTGFSCVTLEPVISCTLYGILDSEILRKAGEKATGGKILPMKEVAGKTLRAFGNHIEESGIYPGLDMEKTDPDISMFYQKDDEILGCILMRRVSDKELMNEWVFLDERETNRSLLIPMLSAAAVEAKKLFAPGTKVSFVTINDTSKKLLSKIIPGGVTEYEIRRYEQSLKLI